MSREKWQRSTVDMRAERPHFRTLVAEILNSVRRPAMVTLLFMNAYTSSDVPLNFLGLGRSASRPVRSRGLGDFGHRRCGVESCEVRVEFRLRADPSDSTPISQHIRADVRAIRPNQCAILDCDFPELCRLVQGSKNWSVQRGTKVEHATPAVPEFEAHAGGLHDGAVCDLGNWIHGPRIMPEAGWVAKAVAGAPGSIGAAGRVDVGAPIRWSGRARGVADCPAIMPVSGLSISACHSPYRT